MKLIYVKILFKNDGKCQTIEVPIDYSEELMKFVDNCKFNNNIWHLYARSCTIQFHFMNSDEHYILTQIIKSITGFDNIELSPYTKLEFVYANPKDWNKIPNAKFHYLFSGWHYNVMFNRRGRGANAENNVDIHSVLFKSMVLELLNELINEDNEVQCRLDKYYDVVIKDSLTPDNLKDFQWDDISDYIVDATGEFLGSIPYTKFNHKKELKIHFKNILRKFFMSYLDYENRFDEEYHIYPKFYYDLNRYIDDYVPHIKDKKLWTGHTYNEIVSNEELLTAVEDMDNGDLYYEFTLDCNSYKSTQDSTIMSYLLQTGTNDAVISIIWKKNKENE